MTATLVPLPSVFLLCSFARMTRRFPAPWTVEEIPGGFRVLDANGVSVAWVYAWDDLHKHTDGLQWLTTDEARRIAIGIARLPEFIAQSRKP